MSFYAFDDVVYIKKNSSESWPRKVELTHMHSRNVTAKINILHVATKPAFDPMKTKTSLIAVIFII